MPRRSTRVRAREWLGRALFADQYAHARESGGLAFWSRGVEQFFVTSMRARDDKPGRVG